MASSARLISDAEREHQIRHDVDRLHMHAREFFGALQMVRFDLPGGQALAGTESRIRVRAQHLTAVWEIAQRLSGALQALEADLALAEHAPEDVLALARRALAGRIHPAGDAQLQRRAVRQHPG